MITSKGLMVMMEKWCKGGNLSKDELRDLESYSKRSYLAKIFQEIINGI